MISSRMTRWLTLFALAATVAVALPARANTWPLPPPGSKVVGENRFHVVENNGGSLEAIAKKYNVGFLALLQANPGVDPYVPRAGSVLTIPLQTILPDAPREGIVINLAELRLYYYPPGKNEVTVYPIGIGQLGGDTLTPTMVTTVSDKRANPTWTPTANIRARYKAQGIDLPAVVPAGPDNPMGHHAIRLAAYGGVYLLHGTNADFGIGMRVSSGCIRLRDDDIKTLFNVVRPGTTQVTPSALFSSEISFTSTPMVMGSCPTKGSSNMMRSGSSAIARASAARRAIPPESSEGISLAAPRSPTASSFIITVLCNNGAGSWVCSRSG